MRRRAQHPLRVTVDPTDVNSRLLIKLAGVDIGLDTRLEEDVPVSQSAFQLIAGDPVAAANIYRVTVGAVLRSIPRFNAVMVTADGSVESKATLE